MAHEKHECDEHEHHAHDHDEHECDDHEHHGDEPGHAHDQHECDDHEHHAHEHDQHECDDHEHPVRIPDAPGALASAGLRKGKPRSWSRRPRS